MVRDFSNRRLSRAKDFGLAKTGLCFLALLASTVCCGCSHRPRAWGFPGAQGTVDRQKSRATIHDPYPLNDIGPEVMGGRPREFMWPQSEAARETNVPLQYRNLPYSY